MSNMQNEGKNKNYYALNLTEGRIFIIFILFIVIIAGIVFGVVFLFSKGKNPDQNKVTVEKQEDKNNGNNDFSYYSELKNEDKNKVDIEKKDNENKQDSTTVANKDNVEKKENSLELKDKKDAVESKEKESVKLDNSKVLYSSDYIKNNETKKAVENKKPQNKQEKPVAVQNKEQPKKAEKKALEEKYIVQIGSYLNKKTADEISLFYKIQGYPAYIIEKKENDKTFYRLRIGPFVEKNKAETNLENIKKSKYGENSFISKVYL